MQGRREQIAVHASNNRRAKKQRFLAFSASGMYYKFQQAVKCDGLPLCKLNLQEGKTIMKNFAALSAGLLASAVLAAPTFAADKPTAYVYDSQKVVVKDGAGKCVLNGHIALSKETAIKACNPEFFKEEPKVEAKPAVEAPKPPVVAAKKITLNADTYFDFDKYNLKPEGKKALDALVAEMKINQVEEVIVVGHTDSIGTEAYNQKLSERRAKTVADYLVSKGVPAAKIKAFGKGESQPIADNRTKAGRAKNRRVEVTVNAASK